MVLTQGRTFESPWEILNFSMPIFNATLYQLNLNLWERDTSTSITYITDDCNVQPSLRARGTGAVVLQVFVHTSITED